LGNSFELEDSGLTSVITRGRGAKKVLKMEGIKLCESYGVVSNGVLGVPGKVVIPICNVPEKTSRARQGQQADPIPSKETATTESPGAFLSTQQTHNTNLVLPA